MAANEQTNDREWPVNRRNSTARRPTPPRVDIRRSAKANDNRYRAMPTESTPQKPSTTFRQSTNVDYLPTRPFTSSLAGTLKLIRSSGSYCEVCGGDSDCSTGEYCLIGEEANACVACHSSCATCVGTGFAQCASCVENYIPATLASSHQCLECPSCDETAKCVVNTANVAVCGAVFDCGGGDAQTLCEALQGAFEADGRAKIVLTKVTLRTDGGYNWPQGLGVVAYSRTMEEATDGSAATTREIDLSSGVTNADAEVAIQLVLGAVHVDQPIRVGLWANQNGWRADLETFSRGDRWIHPLDFASSATLNFEFDQSRFTLYCEGCRQLARAAMSADEGTDTSRSVRSTLQACESTPQACESTP
eukprot:1180348-Prorocentrum_minimum.AAC.1